MEVSPAGPIGAYRSSVLVVIGTITDERFRVLGRVILVGLAGFGDVRRVVLMREWGARVGGASGGGARAGVGASGDGNADGPGPL
jgi:hypothetical protein